MVRVMVVVVVANLHPLLPPVHSPSVRIKVNHKEFLILKTGCIHSGHVKDIMVGVVCPVEEWVPCEVVAIFLAEPGRGYGWVWVWVWVGVVWVLCGCCLGVVW